MNDTPDNNLPAPPTIVIRPRLPVPKGVNPQFWQLLTDVVFPGANDPNKILLAWSYCHTRRLDVLKRPVNIVSTWDSRQGRNVEGIWPAIGETEITASRTGEYAGCDKALFGPEVTKEFSGRIKTKKGWEDVKRTVTYPTTCDVTVYRIIKGVRCPFTITVYWEEEYGRLSGSAVPNGMWQKRVHDQIAKVARAASLRAAFPEEGAGPTAEEMEGKVIGDEVVIEAGEVTPPSGPADNWQPPDDIVEGEVVEESAAPEQSQEAKPQEAKPENQAEPNHDPLTGEIIDSNMVIEELELIVADGQVETWISWGNRFLKRIAEAPTNEHIDEWLKRNKTKLTGVRQDAEQTYRHIENTVRKRRQQLTLDEQAKTEDKNNDVQRRGGA